MTPDLQQACTDLAAWLPAVAELITEPDTIATDGSRPAPDSKPPWNAEAAGVYYNIHAMVRDAEQELRQQVTGTMARRQSWSEAATIAAIKAIGNLAEAAPISDIEERKRQINHAINQIMALPAIDRADPDTPIIVRRACPYCNHGDLRMMRNSLRITCLRLRQCFDSHGAHPKGVLEQSKYDRQWYVYWEDGLVT